MEHKIFKTKLLTLKKSKVMAKTHFCKNGTISIIGLTLNQYSILCDCLSKCRDVMEWDDDEKCASDGDNFIWQMEDKREFNTLKTLYI